MRHSCGHILICMLEEASMSKTHKFDKLKLDMSLLLNVSTSHTHVPRDYAGICCFATRMCGHVEHQLCPYV
jgi:hypothetical protein